MAAELSARLDGRHVPQAIGDFMRQPWAHHVTMTVLREGEDGEGLRDALVLADGVMEELAEAQRQIIGKPWLQTWRPSLQKVFASVGMNPDAASSAVDALHDTLQAVAASRPELEKSCPSCAGGPAAGQRGRIHSDPTGGRHDSWISTAPTPTIFRGLRRNLAGFIDKATTKSRPASCPGSARSPRDVMFVNRRGVRFCVASPRSWRSWCAWADCVRTRTKTLRQRDAGRDRAPWTRKNRRRRLTHPRDPGAGPGSSRFAWLSTLRNSARHSSERRTR